jgi:hypothetical protein
VHICIEAEKGKILQDFFGDDRCTCYALGPSLRSG